MFIFVSLLVQYSVETHFFIWLLAEQERKPIDKLPGFFSLSLSFHRSRSLVSESVCLKTPKCSIQKVNTIWKYKEREFIRSHNGNTFIYFI